LKKGKEAGLMLRKTTDISVEMDEVRQQFENWRSTHAPRSRIPETLWTSAVKLARQYGLYQTSRVLRLDYARLKAQVGPGAVGEVKKASAFVEFVAAGSPECVVELENARGKKMRIQFRGVGTPDLAELSRMFWSSKA
jgi:hypothetical protein